MYIVMAISLYPKRAWQSKAMFQIKRWRIKSSALWRALLQENLLFVLFTLFWGFELAEHPFADFPVNPECEHGSDSAGEDEGMARVVDRPIHRFHQLIPRFHRWNIGYYTIKVDSIR